MDNKKLNEQESLELITRMIQNTKVRDGGKFRDTFFSCGDT